MRELLLVFQTELYVFMVWEMSFGELIEFENGVLGLALNLEQDSVGVVVWETILD